MRALSECPYGNRQGYRKIRRTLRLGGIAMIETIFFIVFFLIYLKFNNLRASLKKAILKKNPYKVKKQLKMELVTSLSRYP